MPNSGSRARRRPSSRAGRRPSPTTRLRSRSWHPRSVSSPRRLAAVRIFVAPCPGIPRFRSQTPGRDHRIAYNRSRISRMRGYLRLLSPVGVAGIGRGRTRRCRSRPDDRRCSTQADGMPPNSCRCRRAGPGRKLLGRVICPARPPVGALRRGTPTTPSKSLLPTTLGQVRSGVGRLHAVPDGLRRRRHDDLPPAARKLRERQQKRRCATSPSCCQICFRRDTNAYPFRQYSP